MRSLSLVVVVALLGGCASDGTARSTARNVLVAVAIGSAAIAVGSAVAGRSSQNSLHDDVAGGTVTGHQFVDRNTTGLHWNRATRASAFVSGLSVFGLGVVWELGQGDRIQRGPAEHTPADDKTLIFPVPHSAGYSSATAK